MPEKYILPDSCCHRWHSFSNALFHTNHSLDGRLFSITNVSIAVFLEEAQTQFVLRVLLVVAIAKAVVRKRISGRDNRQQLPTSIEIFATLSLFGFGFDSFFFCSILFGDLPTINI